MLTKNNKKEPTTPPVKRMPSAKHRAIVRNSIVYLFDSLNQIVRKYSNFTA